MAKAPTKAELARALCEKYPKQESRSLAKRLYADNKLLFKNLESARTAVRYVRGTNGDRNRNVASVKVADGFGKKRKAGQGSTLTCPPSLAEEWTPYELPTGFGLSISDIHLPYHSEIAVNAAINHAKRRTPDWVLLNGDLADFYSVSRWDKDPKKRGLAKEVETIRSFLDWLRECFPKAKIVYKAGNHEERWDKFIWNKAPELFDIDQCRWDYILGLEQREIDLVTDGRPVLAGKLPIFHGHELPKGLTNPVNQARGAFLRTLSTTLTAHGHRSSTHPEADMWHNVKVSWSQACLCDLRPEYARINKWNWGFAEIDVARDGNFEVDNYQISKDAEVMRV